MKVKALGILLFSFAFSSAPSSCRGEIPVVASKGAETKAVHLTGSQGENHLKGSTTSQRDHGLEKREVGVFRGGESGQKGSERSILNSNLLLLDKAEDLSKRNRMGFTGMRGKKDSGPTSRLDTCKTDGNPPEDSPIEKRALRNYKALFGGKRAPLAFQGMRGKKSEEYENAWSAEPEILDLRLSPTMTEGFYDSGVFGVEYPELIDSRKEGEMFEEDAISKRSPYSFQGMRGKKTYLPYDSKRARGFLGMRGKKATEIWQANDSKRSPQTGFFGMKGKKAQSGFFGMRGKKPSLSAAYDVEDGLGTSLKYDINAFNLLDQIKEMESSKGRFRRGANWMDNRKNTFFGIRGRKSTDENLHPNFFSANE